MRCATWRPPVCRSATAARRRWRLCGRLATEQACAELRAAVGLDDATRALLIATEGPTDPDGYRAIIG